MLNSTPLPTQKQQRIFYVMISVIVLIAVILILKNNFSPNALYLNETYHITFKYPQSWRSIANTRERYGDQTGFFQVGTVASEGMTIDDVTLAEAFHALEPYGSKPIIQNTQIGSQETRIILPSADQREEMKQQSAVIIRSPRIIQLNNEDYQFLILWVDKNHLQTIISTLQFQ